MLFRSFQGYGLRKVIIPATITEIESGYFFIDSSDQYFYYRTGAFCGCFLLESVTIKSNVLKYIASYAFAECPSLKEINIPNSVTVIGEGAFLGCNSLESIILPENLKSIGGDRYICIFPNTSIYMNGAFSGTALRNIYLPESIEYIGVAAFSECALLKNINIPNSLKDIPDFLFYYCNSLDIGRAHV